MDTKKLQNMTTKSNTLNARSVHVNTYLMMDILGKIFVIEDQARDGIEHALS